MTNIPTPEDGPLHTPDATLDNRSIQASFETRSESQTTREHLIQGGIAADRLSVIDDAAGSTDVQAAVQAQDQGLFACLRETILPNDGNAVTIRADKFHEAILEVHAAKREFEIAVKIIEGSNLNRFDARLERWLKAS